MSATTQLDDNHAVTTLRVASGPHAQACAPLRQGSTTVGSDAGNDVVLVDDLLAPFHFRLDRAGADMRLHAMEGPVLLGGRIVAAEQSAPCRGEATLQAGNTIFQLPGFHLAGLHAVEAAPGGKSGAAVLTGLAAFAAGVACTAIALIPLGLHAAVRWDSGVHPPAVAAVVEPVRPAAAPPVAATGALEALRQRIASAGLGSVALTATADNSVEARGDIMPQQVAAWHETQRWFDGTFGSRAVLVNQVVAAADAPPLAIQAVWPGPHPYVIDGGGQKLFAGAALHGGWTVERIEADRVLIRRGGQTLAVRF